MASNILVVAWVGLSASVCYLHNWVRKLAMIQVVSLDIVHLQGGRNPPVAVYDFLLAAVPVKLTAQVRASTHPEIAPETKNRQTFG